MSVHNIGQSQPATETMSISRSGAGRRDFSSENANKNLQKKLKSISATINELNKNDNSKYISVYLLLLRDLALLLSLMNE